MDCCAHCAAADRIFSAQSAEADVRRYRRKGPDATTRLMLEELRRWPVDGARLLDIGGGIGVLGIELLSAGAREVTMVDASSAYLDAARRQFGERGHADRMRTVLGDFATLAEKPDPADIVTLDRVVCCYPDGEGLLARAAASAGTALAFSYPRDRWYVRAVIALENLWRRMTGSAFRAFVHPPARLASVLEASGLRRVSRRGTLVWVVDLYLR